MSVRRSRDVTGPYYRRGSKGAKCRYVSGDAPSRARARKRAEAAGAPRTRKAASRKFGGDRPKLQTMDMRGPPTPARQPRIARVSGLRHQAPERSSKVRCDYYQDVGGDVQPGVAWPGQNCPKRPGISEYIVGTSREI